MRIHLKCSCGAEAEFCDDRSIHGDASRVFGGPEFKPDAQGRLYHVEVVADRWHMDHAKCREAWREDAEDSSLLSKALREHADIRTSTEPRNECSHSWIHKSNTAGTYMLCQKCHKMEVDP